MCFIVLIGYLQQNDTGLFLYQKSGKGAKGNNIELDPQQE